MRLTLDFIPGSPASPGGPAGPRIPGRPIDPVSPGDEQYTNTENWKTLFVKSNYINVTYLFGLFHHQVLEDLY